MVLDGKFSQEYPATSEFLNVLFMVLHFSEYTLITFLIFNVASYADDTALYSKCDQESDLWKQLALASALESDLQNVGGRNCQSFPYENHSKCYKKLA